MDVRSTVRRHLSDICCELLILKRQFIVWAALYCAYTASNAR